MCALNDKDGFQHHPLPPKMARRSQSLTDRYTEIMVSNFWSLVVDMYKLSGSLVSSS